MTKVSVARLSKCLLLVAALLAGEFDASGAFFGLDAVGRAAFAAGGLDPRVALLDDKGLLFHGLADQALGLLAHRLLRHSRTCHEERLPRPGGRHLTHFDVRRHAASGVNASKQA